MKTKTCGFCKYRHIVEGYDQSTGMIQIVLNWCDKDRNLMNDDKYPYNDKHFIEPCEHFEEGKGTIEEYKEC